MTTTKKCIPVVYYHHVHPLLDCYTSITPSILDQHLGWLSECFYISSVTEALTSTLADAGRPALALCFDDAYEDCFIHARPVLDRHGAHATFVAISSFVGRENVWNRDAGYVARHMGWRQLAVLQSEGHEVGSHGASHTSLEGEGWSAEEEIVGSKRMIEDALGVSVNAFAFPYGRFSAAALACVERTYALSFATGRVDRRPWFPNPHALRRVFLPAAAERELALRIVFQELET